MTIEISIRDLVELVEAAQSNGNSILFMTHTSDGKRCNLVITGEQRRKHRARPAAPKTALASAEKLT